MPRKPLPATGPTYLQVRVPADIKNHVITHCETLQCSLNAWLVECIRRGLREAWGLPEPPPARAPLPTTGDVIREWAAGERLVMPCGATRRCAAVGEDGVWVHDGMGFCGECGIRVV